MIRPLALLASVALLGALVGCPNNGTAAKTEAGKTGEAKTADKTGKATAPKVDAANVPLTAPEGLAWPVKLTAPPEAPAGVPEAERTPLKRVLGLVRLAAGAKIRMLNGLVARTKKMNKRVDLKAMRAAYEEETAQVEARLRGLAVPENLKPLREQVVGALGDQRTFFTRAVQEAEKGRNFKVICEMIPEAAKGSQKLLTGYKKTLEVYGKASPELKKSLQSHLKALDIL